MNVNLELSSKWKRSGACSLWTSHKAWPCLVHRPPENSRTFVSVRRLAVFLSSKELPSFL